MKLSNRQQQIYNLISQGVTEAKILGHRLGIDQKTAQTHRERLMHKLGLVSKAQLLKYVERHPELVCEQGETASNGDS